jgi:hypothetical protein
MQNYHLQNRPNREISDPTEIKAILKKGKYAIISLCRENEPYIVTLSYGYDDINNSLYFHCSTIGLKLDFIKSNPKVCATVIEDGGYIYEECGHNYRTVVFWGEIKFVTDPEEKKHGMKILLDQLENEPTIINEKMHKADNYSSKMNILRLDIEQIHGKAGR